MSKLAKYLNRHIVGNVFDRPSILDDYDTDGSILEATPRLMALPENADDIRRLLRFVNQLARREYQLPVTVRGTGLDKTGAAIGDGLMILTERLNQIEELDVRGRLVRVQAGVTLGELNAALGLHGLCLPIGYHPQVTIGGLIANCINDDYAERYGGIYHFVERAEVVLASGDMIQLAPCNSRVLENKMQASDAEGALYRRIKRLLDRHADTVVERSMRPFDTAGYANIIRVQQNHTTNLLPLMFASQGTLAIVTDVILRVAILPPARRSMIAVFPDERGLLRVLDFIKQLEPTTIKIYDMRVIADAGHNGSLPELLEQGPTEGWLLQVGFNYHKTKTAHKLQHCQEILSPGTFSVTEDDENSADFQEFERMLLNYLNDDSDKQHLPVLDDVYLPSYKLGEFIAGLKILEATLGIELPLYGSYATSNYQVRPEVDCATLDGRRLLLRFLQQYSALVEEHEGSITGGSPEGRVKAMVANNQMSSSERELYQEIKQAFDPYNILSPGVKLDAKPRQILKYLRTTEKPGIIEP